MPRVMRNIGHNLKKLSARWHWEFCFHKRGCYDHGRDHFSPRKAIYGNVTAVSVSHYCGDRSVLLPSWTYDSFPQSCVCLQGRKCPFFQQSRAGGSGDYSYRWPVRAHHPYTDRLVEKKSGGSGKGDFFCDRMLQQVLNPMCGSPLVSPCQERGKNNMQTHTYDTFLHIL